MWEKQRAASFRNEPCPYWAYFWIWPQNEDRNRKSVTATTASRDRDKLGQLSLPSSQRPECAEGKQQWRATWPSLQIHPKPLSPSYSCDSTVEERWNRSVKHSSFKCLLICCLVKTCSETKLEALLMPLFKNTPFQYSKLYLCLLLIITCWPQWLFSSPWLGLYGPHLMLAGN